VRIKFLFILLLSASTTNMSNATSLNLLWESTGFAHPESVLVSREQPWLYVSNTNGEQEGFISRVNKQGRIDTLKWAKGLIAPTGMGIHNNKLYVSDHKFVRVIDINTGKVINSITAKNISMLNDLTVSKDGRIFVSDILGGKIFELIKNKMIVWFESDLLPHPNGVLVKNGVMTVVNLGSKLSQNPTSEEYGSVYKINLNTKEIKRIDSSYKLGGLDGLVSYENGYIISHFPAGEIYYITEKERRLVGNVDVSSADIGIDNDTATLFIPFLFNNKVSAYQIVEPH